MRLLSFPLCLLIAFASAVVAGIAGLIGMATYAEDPLIWTRACVVSGTGKTAASLVCDDFEKTWSALDRDIAAALAGKEIALTCRGYRTRGPFANTAVECGGETP
jgi:hypothetical protein